MSGLTHALISQYAAELGFSAAYCFPPASEDGAPENVKTLVLLVRAYTPGGRLVDHFYPASNAAYHAAKELADRISEAHDTAAVRLSALRLKPMCRRHPAFGTGKNTLNYLPGIGSRFCMELLGVTAEVTPAHADAYADKSLSCADCNRCAAACPGGAITPRGFQKERCIRFYMLSGRPMPMALRPYIGVTAGSCGIVGCDICQRVCPANAAIEKQRSGEDVLDLAQMLMCDGDTIARFAELYGKNYANRNRIIAQALLAAANLQKAEYLPEIQRLKDSPSALIAEHAAWAAEKMTEKR